MTQTIIGAAIVGCGIISAIHALMTKRDPRSTLGWTILCLLVPGAGAALYWIFGVNRIQTKARRWQERGRFTLSSERSYGGAETPLGRVHPVHAETMNALVRISERVTRRPLLAGNQVEPLYNGEDAYPAMLAAIEAAQISIYLTTYIFDTDEAGMRFIDALGAAADRGVDVRVIVDGIGECYARPRCSTVLRKRHKKVKVGRFLPPALSLRGIRINLRTHRKLLIVDSTIGFTGGMNIGQRHMVTDPANKHATQDLHFRVVGPVVLALEEIFFEDWLFVTGEEHTRGTPADAVVPAGDALCRAISDGPNEDFEVLTWILVGALSTARKRVQIMTPYFIPSRELLSALNAAALRGVMVQIILPRRSNLPFVAWAAQAMLDEVMQYGIQIYYQPEPFNHTKLFVVDEFYTVIGSANLDPRSLRLNFELNVEVYDPSLSERLSQRFDEVRARSHLITPDELYQRNPLLKLRDSLAKLLSPYL